jgi:hypothetical protein
MTRARWSSVILGATVALLAGCGGASVHTVDAMVAEAGFCGTHANPGILHLENLFPPQGGTVNNHNIVHGFTVTDAPAEFSHFDLRFGPTHTAGLPTPENPKFAVATVDSNVVYQLTIVSWSRSPAHVELLASAGFDTSAGCSWSFPSPLFSYNIVGGPDGGAPPESATQQDAGVPVDAARDVALPPADAPLVDDARPPVDAPLDGGARLPVDAPLESGAPDVPESFDLGQGEAAPGTDAPLPVDSGIG